MSKNNIKLKIYKILFYVLLISAIVITGLVICKYGKNQINEKESKKIVEAFSNTDFSKIDEQQNDIQLEYKGYKVIGIVNIPKINIEYPILDINTYNPEETKAPMKISIVKYWGGNVNDYGNLSIAGHNNYDGTMFGKTKKLEEGDIIELTDLQNIKIQYKIYSKFVTDPNDVTILESNNYESREVTLITCTNGNKNRLILKAKEI